MGIKNMMGCIHCKRIVDMLYDVGIDHEGTFLVMSRGCEDCATILREKLNELMRHTQMAKLN